MHDAVLSAIDVGIGQVSSKKRVVLIMVYVATAIVLLTPLPHGMAASIASAARRTLEWFA